MNFDLQPLVHPIDFVFISALQCMDENTRESNAESNMKLSIATKYLKLASRACEHKLFYWDISFLIDIRMRSDGLLKSSS